MNEGVATSCREGLRENGLTFPQWDRKLDKINETAGFRVESAGSWFLRGGGMTLVLRSPPSGSIGLLRQ